MRSRCAIAVRSLLIAAMLCVAWPRRQMAETVITHTSLGGATPDCRVLDSEASGACGTIAEPPASPCGLLFGLLDNRDVQNWRQAIDWHMREWSRKDPEGALAWIALKASESDRPFLLASFAIGLAETDPVCAARAVDLLVLPESERLRAVEGIADVWRHRDVGAAAAWAVELRDSTRDVAFSIVGYTWYSEDAPAALQWVCGLTMESDRDWALARMAAWQLEKDPSEAGTLIAAISDPLTRERAGRGLIRDWARDSYEMAAEWVAKLKSPDFRASMSVQLLAINAQTADPWR